MTEAIEQNNLNEFCNQHNFVNNKELSNQEKELDMPVHQTQEPVNPCCSKDLAPKSKFMLVSSKNSTKYPVTSFTNQVKRKTTKLVKGNKPSKLPKIFTKKTTSTVTTKTTKTSITEMQNNILDEAKNYIQVSDDSDSSLISINL